MIAARNSSEEQNWGTSFLFAETFSPGLVNPWRGRIKSGRPILSCVYSHFLLRISIKEIIDEGISQVNRNETGWIESRNVSDAAWSGLVRGFNFGHAGLFKNLAAKFFE